MIEQSTQDRIAKIYELVKRGSTDGEKNAAKIALDKLLKKHNLNEEFLKTIHLKTYYFKYATNLDLDLWRQLQMYFLPHLKFNASRSTIGGKNIVAEFEYLDFITMETTYEYYKRDMSKKFKVFCAPSIARCRSQKTKNKRRIELQGLFFSRYVIASEIYIEGQLKQLDASKMTAKELSDRKKLENVEGGKFHNQMSTGLYLE